MSETIEVTLGEDGLVIEPVEVIEPVAVEPCEFCKSTAGSSHISVCSFCGGSLHLVIPGQAECASCGKKFDLTAL